MCIKSRLLLCIAGAVLALGMLVAGVLAVSSQNIIMSGDVNFDITDKTLYLRDVRFQSGSGNPQTLPGFRPGYINGEFNINLAGQDLTSTTGTFLLYFDIINLVVDGSTVEYIADAVWTNSPISGAEFAIQTGSEHISVGSVVPSELSSSTPLSGTVVLDVSVYSGTSFDLSNITIAFIDATKIYLPNTDFEISGDTIKIDGLEGASGDVVIPEKVSVAGSGLVEGEDYTVTNIGRDAFRNNKEIETVTLPDSIEKISSGAFAYCTNLESINLPEGLTEIADNSFLYCSSLENVVIPETVTSIGGYAFFNCQMITGTLNIPASVTEIGQAALSLLGLKAFTVDVDNKNFAAEDGILYSIDFSRLLAYPRSKDVENDYVIRATVQQIDGSAFRYCTNLVGSLTLPVGLQQIGSEAFFQCSNLTGTLEIPNSVTNLHKSPFPGCMFSAFTGIDNDQYTIYNGALYDKDITTLIQYPAGKSDTQYVAPDTVTAVENYAFLGSKNLTEIHLSSALAYIGSDPFSGCDGLVSLQIDATVPPQLFDGVATIFDLNFNILVPAQSVDAYKLAWTDYADRIFPQE